MRRFKMNLGRKEAMERTFSRDNVTRGGFNWVFNKYRLKLVNFESNDEIINVDYRNENSFYYLLSIARHKIIRKEETYTYALRKTLWWHVELILIKANNEMINVHREKRRVTS